MLLTAAIIVIALFLMRIVVTRLTTGDGFTARDLAITSMMAPKGLAAAVLATIPAQHGLAGGNEMRDITYTVVLMSIVLCAVLVAIYPNRYVQALYRGLLPSRAPDSE